MVAFLVAAIVCTAFHGGAAAQSEDKSVALVRLDSLGMDSERVSRLETLFRIELGKLSTPGVPGPAKIRALTESEQFRECSDAACLAAIGVALKVDVVVSGNIAALADAYVVNIKAVQSSDGRILGRVASEPLRGSPDELIRSIRVAAYRLLAPERMRGKLTVLADLDGATILLDGRVVGKTPLLTPIGALPLGEHSLEVTADGYKGFRQTIEIQFEKTSQVVVTLTGARAANIIDSIQPQSQSQTMTGNPFYKRGWFWLTVGVVTGAVITGAIIGERLSRPEIVSCPGAAC